MQNSHTETLISEWGTHTGRSSDKQKFDKVIVGFIDTDEYFDKFVMYIPPGSYTYGIMFEILIIRHSVCIYNDMVVICLCVCVCMYILCVVYVCMYMYMCVYVCDNNNQPPPTYEALHDCFLPVYVCTCEYMCKCHNNQPPPTYEALHDCFLFPRTNHLKPYSPLHCYIDGLFKA